MNRTARVILTFECRRRCDYCCNKYKRIIGGAQPISRPTDIGEYDEVCLTGGEPMLIMPASVICWAKWLKRIGVSNVYVYMSAYSNLAALTELLNYVDGIHYTLHEKSTLEDLWRFHEFQLIVARRYTGKSFRLFIHPNFPSPVTIEPKAWTRVEEKPWDGPNTCQLPANEDLFYWRDMCKKPA